MAGFGNAREANNVRGIEIGTVVQLTFFGYTLAPSGMTRPNVNGTFIDGIGTDPAAPSHSTFSIIRFPLCRHHCRSTTTAIITMAVSRSASITPELRSPKTLSHCDFNSLG